MRPQDKLQSTNNIDRTGADMILVSIEMNRFGHLELDPVSAVYADRLRRWQKEQGISRARGDSAAYLQDEGDIGLVLDDLPPGKRRDVESGWTVRVRMDPWTFNALAGLDNEQIKPRARKREEVKR